MATSIMKESLSTILNCGLCVAVHKKLFFMLEMWLSPTLQKQEMNKKEGQSLYSFIPCPLRKFGLTGFHE